MMMKLEASTGPATATPSGLRSRSSVDDTAATTTTTTTLLPAAHTRPATSPYTARADSPATLAAAASSFAPMRTWCDGVQRVTQQYFAALGMLAMAFLGAGGVPRPGSSTSADGLRRDLRVVRGDFQDDEELHVEADDVAAMQMALLQQLYAHRQLQQRKRHSAQHQSTVLRAAEGAATNMAHPSSASAGTRDDRDVSARHGSLNADADEAAATAVPARDVAELLASRLPPELLQLFHTAQTLRASAPAADASPSSSFRTVAGRAPVSAGGQGQHSARSPRDEGRATPDECDREEGDIDGVDAGADGDLYRPLSRESAVSLTPLVSERPHSSSTSVGAVSLSAAGSPSRLCSAGATRAEPPSHIVPVSAPASPPQPPSAAALPMELSDDEAAEAAAMATLCYQYFFSPRLLSPPRSAAAPAMPSSKAPAAAAAPAPRPAPPSKVVVVPAAVAAGSGLDAVLMMQLAQEPQLPPPRRARRSTPPLTAVTSASYASASGTGGGSTAATTSTAALASGSAPHPLAPESPSPADLSTPAAWRRLIAQRVAAEHAVNTLAHAPSATLNQTTGVPPSTAATATGVAAAAALPPPTTVGPHEEEAAAAAGPVPELASAVRQHVHAQLSFGLAPQQQRSQSLKQQQQPEEAATSAQGAPASADGAHDDAPPRTAPATAASTAPGSRAGHAGSGGSSGGGGDRKTEGHARVGAAPTAASVKPGSAGDAMRLTPLPSRASSPAMSAVGGGMAQQQQQHQAAPIAAVVEDGGPASAITAGEDSSAAAPVPVVLSAVLPDVTATATSKSPSRSGRDTTQRPFVQVPKKKARVDSAHLRRSRGLLPPPANVVLPPGHSGFNGEKLTTSQLTQLVVSVKQDGAAAQVSAQQQQTAGDVAAAELYRLQRAVAQLLVENVQLEKDIATLAAGAPSETGTVAAAAAAATAVAPVESRRRPLILPPAPMPLPHASAALTANSLLVGRPAIGRKGKGRGGAASASASAAAASSTGRSRDDAVIVVAQRPWQRQVAALAGNAQSTTRTSRKAATRAYSPTAAVAARASSEAGAAPAPLADPAAILQELCSAASAREEERLRTLAEVDALTSRVEHHDALLSAVAEYWRRNAAIMKRQQYAVQSQPKNSATTTAVTSVAATRAMHSPAGASPLWEDEVPGVGGNGGVPAASVPYFMQAPVTAGSAASSRDDSGVSSPVDNGSPSATITGAMSLSEKMTMLDGSPSQLQRALAQMEALSPTPPSSSLSFDLRPNHASAFGLGYSTEAIGHVVRRQIFPVGLKTVTTTSSNATDVRGSMPTASTTTTLHKTAVLPPAAVTGWTPSDGTNTITATTGLASAAATSGRQPHSHAAPSANTNTNTTLLYSRGGRRIDTGPQAHAGGRAAVKSAATEATVTTAESDFGAAARSDVELLSDSFGTSPRTLSSSAPNFNPTNGTDAVDENTNPAGGSRAGQPAATNTTTARAGAPGVLHRPHAASPYSAEDASVTVAGSPDMHASHTSTETTSRHYASGSGRREDEDVLERGNWRTIPALQLENLDEIAEFIYSVFEQP